MMKAITKIILILGLVLTACSGPAPSLAGKKTPRPNVIFEDDFSDVSSGWETWADPNGSFVAYQNGGMRFLVQEKRFDYWSRPGKRFADASVEVDAVKLAGPNDNDYGLMCRYQDRSNFYAFVISSDGYAGIIKVEQGNYKILTGDQLSFSPSIRRGEALNHLRMDCIGQTLVLAVNGQVVVQAQDRAFASGEIALMAGTNSDPGVDIFFDNFVVVTTQSGG
jgi:hypothetical protein